MTTYTPPQLANKIAAENQARKDRQLLLDFVEYCSISPEIVDAFMESRCG